jgi:hypothetical protein
VGGRIYSSTDEAWADACAAAAADIAYGVVQVQGSGVINSNDNEMLDEYENDDDNKEDDDDDDDDDDTWRKLFHSVTYLSILHIKRRICMTLLSLCLRRQQQIGFIPL